MTLATYIVTLTISLDTLPLTPRHISPHPLTHDTSRGKRVIGKMRGNCGYHLTPIS
nr:MAG TPA: hypothetical protein [Caudoviricetes sp.]